MTYSIQQSQRKGKMIWLVKSDTSADMAVFRTAISAEKALTDLISGTAHFCECGNWILYNGGQSHHTCSAIYKRSDI